MATAPNMRVAPSLVPAGNAAPATADPLEFLSRILAGQAQLPLAAPTAEDGVVETPAADGATAEPAPSQKAGQVADAPAIDPAALEGLIPLVQAQGDYAVAVVVKGDTIEASADAEPTETGSASQAPAAPVAVSAAIVPTPAAATPPTAPGNVRAEGATRAGSGGKIVVRPPVPTPKMAAPKAADPSAGTETVTTKPDRAPPPTPVADAAGAKIAPAKEMAANDLPAPALRTATPIASTPAPRAATPDTSASTPRIASAETPEPVLPVSASAPVSAPADAATPKDASAQIAAAIRGAVTVPDAGVRATSAPRTALQAAERISTAEPGAQPQPQRQQALPSETALPEAQPLRAAANPDATTPAQPATPWSPAAAAPARSIEQPAPGIDPADRTVDRALDMARDGEWLDQLARDISSSGDRDGTLRFRLNPQSLGQLRVELSQSDHGTNVRMSVETEAARTLLSDAQSRLVAEARAQGVRIAETQVDLSASDQHMSGDPRRQEEARQNPMIRTATTSSEREAPARPKASRSDRYA